MLWRRNIPPLREARTRCNVPSGCSLTRRPYYMTTPVLEPMWTIEDVAHYFRCTPRHVRNLMSNGLPCCYLGRLVRFEPEAVRIYVMRKPRLLATMTRRRMHPTQ